MTPPIAPKNHPASIPPEDRHPLGGRRCKAKSKRTGERCGKRAMGGQEVCATHGGSTAAAKAKGEERMAEQRAQAEVSKFGLQVDVSPSEALLTELRWTAGHVEYLRAKVQALSDQALVQGVTKVVDDPTKGRVQTVEAQESIWYSLYLKERKHLVEVAAAAVRAGVEQRRIEIAEQQGLMVAGVVGRILDAMLTALLERGLDPRPFWDSLTGEIVPREFRALEAAM